MTQNTSHLYTLADILGEPISEKEAASLIRSDADSYQKYCKFPDDMKKQLLHFLMGKSGLAVMYDAICRRVLLPDGNTDRLERFLSAIFGKPVTIVAVLDRTGNQINEQGSFIIADIIVRLADGALVNVEIQKIGYQFPGERASCYISDMIMREYNERNHDARQNGRRFNYRKMKPVYLIVLMEQSPKAFHLPSNAYIHRLTPTFDSGLQLQLLENITFVSLDIFHSTVQNISNEQDAWLTFLSATEPNQMLALVNAYPEFLACYHDIISFRKNPKEMIAMFFSEALYQMDRDTERYMVEELQQELDETKQVLIQRENALAEKNNTLAEQSKRIAELEAALASKPSHPEQ